MLHSIQREQLILALVRQHGFLSIRALERESIASPATLRRDLHRLSAAGKLVRVRGGVQASEPTDRVTARARGRGMVAQIAAGMGSRTSGGIGVAAAALCSPGEAVMIAGGPLTEQMCGHLPGIGLQVLTNSMRVVAALIAQPDIHLLLPSGAVMRGELILAADGVASMPKVHAPKLFVGATALGAMGLLQADPVVAAAEHPLIEGAERVIVLVDSRALHHPSGSIVLPLSRIHTAVTDAAIRPEHRAMLLAAGISVVIAPAIA